MPCAPAPGRLTRRPLISRVPFSSTLMRGWAPTRMLPSFSHPTPVGGSPPPTPHGNRAVAPTGSTVRLAGPRRITGTTEGKSGNSSVPGLVPLGHRTRPFSAGAGLTPLHVQAGLGQDTAGHTDGLALVETGVVGLDVGDGDGAGGADCKPAGGVRGLAGEQQRLGGTQGVLSGGGQGGMGTGVGMGMG